jgi:hypothetical protein
MGVSKTGQHVFAFQPGVTLQQRRDVVTGGQHAEYMLHGEATSSDDGLTTVNGGVDGNPFQQSVFMHVRFL